MRAGQGVLATAVRGGDGTVGRAAGGAAAAVAAARIPTRPLPAGAACLAFDPNGTPGRLSRGRRGGRRTGWGCWGVADGGVAQRWGGGHGDGDRAAGGGGVCRGGAGRGGRGRRCGRQRVWSPASWGDEGEGGEGGWGGGGEGRTQ